MSDCQLTRHEILNEMNSWSVHEVVALLQKHELAECCDTIVKRNIDGEELLSLTEKKLELWIIDLGRPLLRHLWQFVNNLQNNPEAYYYVEIDKLEPRNAEDTLSNDGWDTEFEDDGEDSAISDQIVCRRSKWNTMERAVENDRTEVEAEEEEDQEDDECVYANQLELSSSRGMKSDIFKQTADNSDLNELANELRQKLELRQSNRPEIPPKPNIVPKKIVVCNNNVANGGTAVLSNEECYANMGQTENAKRPTRPPVNLMHPAIINPIPTAPPATLKIPNKMKRPILPKPSFIAKPIGITKPLETRLRSPEITKTVDMKLVGRANPNEVTGGSIAIGMPVTGPRNDCFKSSILPKQQNIAKFLDHANQRISPPRNINLDFAGPTQPIETRPALLNPVQNSANNLTKPIGKSQALAEREINLPKPPMSGWMTLPNIAKENLIQDLREEWGLRTGQSLATIPIMPEINSSAVDDDNYEAVPEMEEDARPSQISLGLHTIPKMGRAPPPLPSKPPNMSAIHLNSAERSPEKPSLPLGSQTLPGRLSARPLPLPPERKTDVESWTDKPWYHDVNRAQANALLSRGLTESDSGPLNGQFLLRPSATNPNSPLTLVVWYDHRTYNISIRKRTDNRYALGFNKSVEHSFVRIEDIVNFYKNAALVIYSGGQVIGNTRLTGTPPK